MNTGPNLFRFATSELSQDAVIAYLLSWADPAYKANSDSMHEAGKALVGLFLTRCLPHLAGETIQSIVVGRQRDNIDVWMELNDRIFIVIEDKTVTDERVSQISGYVDQARTYLNSKGVAFEHVGAIYLKTGNESKSKLLKEYCGVVVRRDLLDALKPFVEGINDIGSEFWHHLKEIEEGTTAFQAVEITKDWTVPMVEGFYSLLESELVEKQIASDIKWEYTNNPSGGSCVLYWCWTHFEALNCELYLQIVDGGRLQIRLADWDEKVRSDRMYRALKMAEDLVKEDSRFEQIDIIKSGTYRGGATAGLVDIFNSSGAGFRVANADHLIDIERTIERVRLAVEFVRTLGNRNLQQSV